MLILSRRQGESIVIGDNIEVTITDINRGNVRIGVTSPEQMPVHKREIYDSIQCEKQTQVATVGQSSNE
jgi:carbon storage regulator